MAVAGLYAKRKSAYHGPDEGLVKAQVENIASLRRVYGLPYIARNLLWILKKNPEPDTSVTLPSAAWNRRLVPFRFNRIQRDLVNKMRERNICLKPRQAGYTTFFINVRLFLSAILEPGSGNLLISQTNKYVAQHFGILKRAYRYVACIDPFNSKENLLHDQLVQNMLHTEYSNRRELIFDQIDSRILCESAEVGEAGQGFTLNHVVASEVSRWEGNPEETLANLKEAIAEGGSLDIECTANGFGGYFFREVQRAKNDPTPEFQYFFHPWWWHDEYRLKEALQEEQLTDDEKARMERFNLDLFQMAWRKKKQIELRHNFPEKYPEDDVTCFLTTGSKFFDGDILAARLSELQTYQPDYVGRDGELKVFKKVKKGKRYIIGADVAEGKEIESDSKESSTTDFSAAKVIDLETGEECASLRCKLPPEEFATDLAELGRQYNNALIAVERNNYGGTVILALKIQESYGNIYVHKDWWKRDRKTVIEIEGWPTTTKTRPIMLNKLGWFIKNYPDMIWDITMVEEGLMFVRNPEKAGKPEAGKGAHDDTIFAGAIAQIVRLIQGGYLDPLTWASQKYGEFEEGDEEDAA